MKPGQTRKLRIIGGDWRRSTIEFAEVEAIRPTPDRVRETLFNWLQGDVHGAVCLEPFAGSGILSLEALSRGAAHSTIIDQAQPAVSHVAAALKKLGATPERYHCVVADARSWLQQCQDQKFDLIFLDPPFADDDISGLIATCAGLLQEDGKLYVETVRELNTNDLVAPLEILKQKRAGSVYYALLG